MKAIQGAWGAWAPDEEKDQLIMTGFVGAISGATGRGSKTGLFKQYSRTVVHRLLTPTTAVTSFGGVIVSAYGWSTLFYVSAALTLVWAIIWSGIT